MFYRGKTISDDQHFEDGSEKDERSLDNLISYPR